MTLKKMFGKFTKYIVSDRIILDQEIDQTVNEIVLKFKNRYGARVIIPKDLDEEYPVIYSCHLICWNEYCYDEDDGWEYAAPVDGEENLWEYLDTEELIFVLDDILGY